MPLADKLKPQDNSAAVYFPISARSDKSNEFDWEIINRFFVSALFSISANDKKLAQFQLRCKEHFLNKLSDPAMWDVVEKIYFSKRGIKNIAPEMQIFSGSWAEDANPAPANRIANVVMTLLGDVHLSASADLKLNFIEKEIRTAFKAEFTPNKTPVKGAALLTYLPPLSDVFRADLHYLLSKQHYFLAHLTHFLRFYVFIYTSQMALSINSWKDGEPQKLKDCYFILDNEKASKERSMLRDRGCKQVEKGIEFLFPVLSMNESLQDKELGIVPLWALYPQLTDDALGKLIEYAVAFAQKRDLNFEPANITTLDEAILALLDLSKRQFNKGETRSAAGNKFINFTKSALCSNFTRTRGSAGKVFVIDQEYLLLLTNLAIGEQGKLRLHELIIEFQKRGVFFDRESQGALVEFYERLGNVERLSDSGDAVYVKATI
ncbi:DNA phosphorothioation-dependent restriction protein DptG [uncultured Alteromonas sp.]|jgi:DNA phosphorothioation-dependent restriction protein DptG|uniref:DNA phosphorothioation-dependent restriction protein DptG n=1 Tax=uncultured Alteromonas sp. TaxID=179113 RepID=UPI0025841DA7|nr:DNA phosphorothioation-dependent restriction protein DptG [uncultured Alteromonas sp.]